jgi:hypothetical protein
VFPVYAYNIRIQYGILRVKYLGRGGPWLRRSLWRGASETTGGEFNSARARLWRDSRGTGNTRTHRECHRNRGRLLLPWRVCPWASASSRGRDTGPAHRVLPRSGCAGFARPITWVPNCSRASRYVKNGTQLSVRASPPPTVGRGTHAVFRLETGVARLALGVESDTVFGVVKYVWVNLAKSNPEQLPARLRAISAVSISAGPLAGLLDDFGEV